MFDGTSLILISDVDQANKMFRLHERFLTNRFQSHSVKLASLCYTFQAVAIHNTSIALGFLKISVSYCETI